jgi:Tol biopolymer transport system component
MKSVSRRFPNRLAAWSGILVLLIALGFHHDTLQSAIPTQVSTIAFNKKLAFVSDRLGDTAIFVMDSDGKHQHYLAKGSFPTWSPDGRWIAFNAGDIYVIDANGRNQRHLTADTNRNSNYYPVWSPDGTRLAFISVPLGQTQAHLQVVEVGSGSQSALLDVGAVFSPPAWSPDGQFLAFNSSRDGSYNMYVLRLKDSQLIAQMHNAGGESAPVWAADGKRIAFVESRTSFDMQICVFELITTHRHCLTQSNSADTNNFMPMWSPDAAHIVFVSSSPGNHIQLYVMDADGRNQRRLTNGIFDSFPVWSLDGTQIAFVSERDGNDEIYIIGTDGSNIRRLTHNDVRDILPVWQP